MGTYAKTEIRILISSILGQGQRRLRLGKNPAGTQGKIRRNTPIRKRLVYQIKRAEDSISRCSARRLRKYKLCRDILGKMIQKK